MADDDLHQAIQAAITALCDQHPAIGLSDPWAQVARIAVETAAPVLLQATRDRLAALEVHAAELHDVLEQLWDLFGSQFSSDPARAFRTDGAEIGNRVRAALQVDGPARGHTILEEVQRLRALTAVPDVPTHPFVAEQRSNLCLLFVQGGRTCGKERDDPIHAFDRAAQREVDR
jgi:hypothetical protein